MRFLRQSEVVSRVGLSRTTLWRLEREGLFPIRRQITPTAVGWIESEVTEWIQSRPAAAGAAADPDNGSD